MKKDYPTGAHLSKDELLQILNEIDCEHQSDHKAVEDRRKESDHSGLYPNPSNPFF